MSNQSPEWRRIVDRQHDQINQRTNVYLILNGLLLAAASATIVKLLPTVLSIFGVAINVFWLLLGEYSMKRYLYFYETLLKSETELDERDRIYTQIQNNAPKPPIIGKFKLSSSDFYCTYLPGSMVILWILVLLIIVIF